MSCESYRGKTALADFARHLIGMLEKSETQSFPAIFDVVERLHLDGDGYVSEAATIGLLEDLQNGNLHSKTVPEEFRRFLGKESQYWWDELDKFWQGLIPFVGASKR
jgi:hypothetical protein